MITATTPSADTAQAAPSADLLFAVLSEDALADGPEFIDFLAKHSPQAVDASAQVAQSLPFGKELPYPLTDQTHVLGLPLDMQNLPEVGLAAEGLPANFAAQRAALEEVAVQGRLALQASLAEDGSSPNGAGLLAVALSQPNGLGAEKTVEVQAAALHMVELASSLAPLLPPEGVNPPAAVADQLGAEPALVQPVLVNPLAAMSVQAVHVLAAVPGVAVAAVAANPSEFKSALLVQGAQPDLASQGAKADSVVQSAQPDLAAQSAKAEWAVALARPLVEPVVPGFVALNSDVPVLGEKVAAPAAVAVTETDALALVQMAESAATDKALGVLPSLTAVSSAVVQSPLVASLGDSSSVSRPPIEPHLMRLDSGPVQVEVLKMVRHGGGQIVLELTPPDQGSYRIDLRLDLNGRAQLVIEGASDSVRTRLEQGEAGLKEQFAQMGLELQLNFSRHNQGHRLGQGDGDATDLGGMNPGASPTDHRASRSYSGQTQALVHLYA